MKSKIHDLIRVLE